MYHPGFVSSVDVLENGDVVSLTSEGEVFIWTWVCMFLDLAFVVVVGVVASVSTDWKISVPTLSCMVRTQSEERKLGAASQDEYFARVGNNEVPILNVDGHPLENSRIQDNSVRTK